MTDRDVTGEGTPEAAPTVTFEFTADGSEDVAEIARRLLENAADPRSPAYERALVRPEISLLRVFLFVLIPPALIAAGIIVALNLGAPPLWVWLTAAAVMILHIFLNLKRIIVGTVRLYQRFAPDHIRKKCRFEPSCSEYMILAVEKYGAVRGLFRGIGRLRRCRPGHGGHDYP